MHVRRPPPRPRGRTARIRLRRRPHPRPWRHRGRPGLRDRPHRGRPPRTGRPPRRGHPPARRTGVRRQPHGAGRPGRLPRRPAHPLPRAAPRGGGPRRGGTQPRTLPGRLSAHADAGQVVDWLRGAPAPHTTYLVHGEEGASAALRDRIDRQLGWTAVVPRSGEAVLVR
ncbi:MBL fold metallo-hydrolase RNA specificity domain-containing protein [Streptomyces sp. NPDC101118]|uniref:MBL fold metallo-hydrolase RNA specificity domain-containing protein n=1 Tax=Streptomyces sp. NPDC101118 TaxID=3366109 RepID=UPI0038297717